MRIKKSRLAGMVASGAVIACAGAALGQYSSVTFVTLPPVGTQNLSGTLVGMSGDAKVVVGHSPANGQYGVWRWREETGVEMLAIPAGAGSSAYATQVSRDGRTVLGMSDNGIVRWDEAGVGTYFVPPAGFTLYWMDATSGNGEFAHVEGTFNQRPWPARWRLGGEVVLFPYIEGMTVGPELKFNEDGTACVGNGGINGTLAQPMFWRPHLFPTFLEMPEWAEKGFALRVTPDARVVAGHCVGSGRIELVRWCAPEYRAEVIGSIARGTDGVMSLSADGSTVVFSFGSSFGRPSALYVWRAEHGLVHLDPLLAGHGVPPSNWDVGQIIDVSDDGRTLLGWGSRHPTGLWSFLIRLGVCGTSDFDGDGDWGTDADIEAFFACLGGACCATCFAGGADFNGDGDTGTDADIESFFRVLGGGEC